MSTQDDKIGLVFHIPANYNPTNHAADIRGMIEACSDTHLAALRLASAGLQPEYLVKRADALRSLGHEYDIAVIIDDHVNIALDCGLDGVHLTRPDAKTLRDTKKRLDKDAIIGVSAGASRHDGMILGEIGCDYVAFGPLGFRGFEEEIVNPELFQWWAAMIEIPIIAEGVIDRQTILSIRDWTDFVTLGTEIFGPDDPIQALRSIGALNNFAGKA